MTATDELRRLLNEQGTEHYDYGAEVWWGGESSGGGGAKYMAYEQTDGLICVEIADLTPEQAIEATLESDGEYERKMDSLLCRLTGGLFSKTKAYSLDFMESCVEEAFEAGNARQTSTTHAVTVSDESTDGATGHCECELCGQPIDPWDRFCRHCGAEVVDR